MQNTIPVRFGPAGSPVNPMVYGQFIEHLLNCIDGCLLYTSDAADD